MNQEKTLSTAASSPCPKKTKWLSKLKGHLFSFLEQPLSALIKKRLDKLIQRMILKDKKFLERLKTRLAVLSREEELFQKAPTFSSRPELLLASLRQMAQSNMQGLILEFGVFKGKTITLIGQNHSGPVYGFDSFQGLPGDWVQGNYKVARKGKRDLGEKLPVVPANVQLIKGWFDQTLLPFLKDHPGPVAFAHIDSDLYSSAQFVLNHLPFQNGSVIVFDEYFNYPGWEDGEYKAFQEFLSSRPEIKATCIGYCDTSNQAAFQLHFVPVKAKLSTSK